MKAAKIFLSVSLLVVLAAGLVCQAASAKDKQMEKKQNTSSLSQSCRERLSFNDKWLFCQGDPPDSGSSLNYETLKPWIKMTGSEFSVLTSPAAGSAPPQVDSVKSFAGSNFDDQSWRKLNLPHDWAAEGRFQKSLDGPTGRLTFWGPVWYRKHFQIDGSDQGKQVYLDIDGAMSYSTVWLNGHLLGGWPYGYASYELNLTPYLNFAGENVLAIRLQNPPESSRWYPGAGIYRNVWLSKCSPVHVAHWGTFVKTPEITPEKAGVNITIDLLNETADEMPVSVKTEICPRAADGTAGGAVCGAVNERINIDGHGKRSILQTFTLNHPRLWDLKNPQLYVAVTSVSQNGRLLDRYETPFGLRTIKFDPARGFLLNGERLKLNGVCNHHDLGPIGSALNLSALRRQLSILKEMGCNAIRTSHNPPAPELLDLCDSMGFVVMDEAFDCWEKEKRPGDYHLLFADWHEKDLRAQIRRDRNHPSVILWSIGNEIPESNTEKGNEIGAHLAAIVHEEDASRPVTAACHYIESGYNGFQKVVDVFGYNYHPQEYARFHKEHPDITLFGSETASCITSRGEYFFPVSDKMVESEFDFQMNSYDLAYPEWATSPDLEFKGQDEVPGVAGEFVWTGFDYIGEPTPYGDDLKALPGFTDAAQKARCQKELKETGKITPPSRSSYFGIVDLCGFKKDRFYLYQARWCPDLPMAHILPHWNWPERVGQVTPVHVYTSGDEAELFLNGKSLGRKKKEQYHYRLRWDDVVYQPGRLKVVAYKNGKEWASDSVATTGPAASLSLQGECRTLNAAAGELAFVTVAINDKDGARVPQAKNALEFEVKGPAQIVATDSGDASDLVPFTSVRRKAFNGLGLVVLRATGPGSITLRAKAEGLQEGKLTLSAQ